jgi:hypothetical protein
MTEIAETTGSAAGDPKRTGVITRYARAWERGDFGEVVQCYDEQIVAHYGGQSEFAGTYIGRDRFLTLLLKTSIRANRKLIAIDQLHDDGECGAFFVTESVVINDETVTLRRALRFKTNGKAVTECWLFDHDQHLVDRAWAQPVPESR